MANFALNYSFSRNLNIPLDEDAVKALRSDVVTYVQTKSKCYAGQLFSVTGDTAENNGLYIAVSTGENALIIKLASQDALDAVAASAGKIDKIQLNGTDLTINDKVVNIDLSTYATIEYVDGKIDALADVYAPKAEFEEVQKKVEEITSTGGEPNVQSDWNTTDTEADSYIKNKPDLSVYATQSALNEAQTAIAGDITDAINALVDVYAPKDAFETLVGEDVNKSARAIAAEEVAKVVADADTDFDTLKEIADWIASDTTGSAQMANDIADLKAVNADTRLEALESDQHVHENKDVIDGITAEKVAAWDAAEQNAKTYADGKETAIHTWVEEKNYLTEHQDISNLAFKTEVLEAEGRASAYTDAEISKLADVYDAKGAAASAETAAKAYAKEYTDAEIGKLGNTYATTASVDTIKTTLENKIATDIEAAKTDVNAIAKGYADAAEGNAKTYAEGLAVNYDKAGDAAKALVDAKAYADSLAEDYDAAGAATSAEAAAKEYADSLAVNYDAAGAAASAETAAKEYADSLAVNYDAAGAAVSAAASALTDAKNFTTSEIAKLSEVYDAKGAAATAEENAKKYVNETLVDYATKSYVTDTIVGQLSGGTVVIEGYAKVEDVKAQVASAKTEAIESAKEYADDKFQEKGDYEAAGAAAQALEDAKEYADGKFQEKGDYEAAGAAAQALEDAKAYIDAISANTRLEVLEAIDHDKLVADAIATVVAEAPEHLDTLQEIAAWIENDTTGAAKMANDIESLKAISADTRLETLESISGQSHTHENKEVLDGISSEKVAAWDAAEQNAKDYADGLASNYDVAGAAASAETAAKEYADGLAVNYDAAGAAASALTEAKDYADGLASNYDAAGAAAQALEDAKDYADGLVENIKPYEGGVATSIAMGENETYVVDVKVAADTENKKNFLDVNEANELEVTEITLDVAKTSKEIVVEGGAWESIVKPIFGSSVPAGTTWESFLEAMLCVEKFPGTISTSSAFTVSCGNINPGIDKSGTVEVGTVVTLNKTVANDTTASQSITVGTFSGDGKTYGYKLGENGAHVASKTYTETLTPSLKTSSKALKITFSGFADAVNSGSVIETKTGEGEIAAVTMYAMKGTNKVTVYQTGDTYTSSSAVTAGTIYAATNLKNYYKSDKVTPNTHTPSCPAVDKTASDSTEYTITGAHKYFIGDVTDYSEDYWDTDRSAVVRGLKTSDWATASTIVVAHTFKIGTKQQTVVIPATYTSVSGKDANNGDVTFNHVKTFDFTNAQGYISSYKVFVAPSTDGLTTDSTITVTIK